MSDKKTVAHNLGKGRYVFDRAKNYIQSVLYFVQFGMQVATVLALYKVGMFWLATMAAGLVVCIALFIWFMRFDIAHNLPAEHGWVWGINPAYQKLVNDHLTLSGQMAETQRQIRILQEMISGSKDLMDAERYRWLKKHNMNGSQMNQDCVYLHIVGRDGKGEIKFIDNTGYDLGDLDSLVDKARGDK